MASSGFDFFGNGDDAGDSSSGSDDFVILGAGGDGDDDGDLAMNAGSAGLGLDFKAAKKVPVYTAAKAVRKPAKGRYIDVDRSGVYDATTDGDGDGESKAPSRKRRRVGDFLSSRAQRVGVSGGLGDYGDWTAGQRAGFGRHVTGLTGVTGPYVVPSSLLLVDEADAIFGFGTGLSDRKNARAIVGSGILNPIMRQAQVVVTLYGNKDEHGTRMQTPESDRLVPVGGEGCYKSSPGEIFWIRSHRGGSGPTRGTPPAEGWEHTTTVNGLTGHWKVGGIVQTFRDQQDTNSEELNTGMIHGAMSTTHDGWNDLFPGDKCGVSLTPRVMYDSKGHVMPVITQPGRPADKFVGGTYPLDHQVIGAQLATIRTMIDGQIDAFTASVVDSKNGAMTTAKADGAVYFASVIAALEQHRQLLELRDGDVTPVNLYGRWYAMRQSATGLLGMIWKLLGGTVWKKYSAALLACLSATITMRDKNRYIRRRNVYLPGQTEDVTDSQMQKFMEMCRNAPDSYLGSAQVIANGDMALFTFFERHCTEQMDHAIVEHLRYLSEHTLGTVLSFTQPGGQLDLLVHPGRDC